MPTDNAPTSHCSRWTQQELDNLVAWAGEGVRYGEIARRLGRTIRGIYGAIDRQKSAAKPLPAYRCGMCRTLRPAELFTPSMRRTGGRCRPCQGRAEPRTSPVNLAGSWLQQWVREQGGSARRSDAVAAGAAFGHSERCLTRAVSKWGLVSLQRHSGVPTSKVTYGWWCLSEAVEPMRAADAKALQERKQRGPRANAWSIEDEEELIELDARGYSHSEIGQALGRSKSAIHCRKFVIMRRAAAAGMPKS